MKKFLLISLFAVFAALAIPSVSTAGAGGAEGLPVVSDSHGSHEQEVGKGVHVKSDTHTGDGVHVPDLHGSEKPHASNGVHVKDDLHGAHGEKSTHDQGAHDLKGAHAIDHVPSKGGVHAGIKLDKKVPCDSLLDCGCYGCKRSAEAAAAFLAVADDYVPEEYMVSVRSLVAEYLPKTLAVIYPQPYGDKPQKPPKH